MVRAFYLKNASWEIDFITNDIFRGGGEFGIETSFFNETTPLFVDSNDIGNCVLVINDSYSFDKIEKMVRRMKPFAIFHLSDETGAKSDWLVLSKLVKYYFKQYNHRNYRIDMYDNIIQIPCAYAPTMFAGKCSLDMINAGLIKPIKDRVVDWAFIGTIKSDRHEMCSKFDTHFKTGRCYTGMNCWDATKQVVSPSDMAEIYRGAVFAPIGRGNITLDCSRVYEAIMCGAIPVIVADDGEIDNAFWFNGRCPAFIRATTWDEAIGKCKRLLGYELQTPSITSPEFSGSPTMLRSNISGSLQTLSTSPFGNTEFSGSGSLQTMQDFNLTWWKELIEGYWKKIGRG